MSNREIYDNPLIGRYASRAMARTWSPQVKFSTWRKLWIALAEAEQALGLNITAPQIEAMKAAVDSIDFAAAEAYEKRFRHDVMAHIHAFGDAAPAARPIIHLGATSCYVTDNTDLILLRESLLRIRDRLASVIDALGTFADRWKSLPCLGYTHFQPAQLVTVGKRATLWCQELIFDLEDVEHRLEGLKFLGVKGTTGTQASFLALFDGDHAKVEELDRRVAASFGFDESYAVSGQTYSRKVDSQVMATLAGLGESAHRFGMDLRLLAHERELEEPFEAEQIGSSAMAYKRNPMRAERLCSLARFLMALPAAASQTSATQWLERTLDDSAVRRLTLPQGFLAADAILSLYANIVPGLVVHAAVIDRHLAEQLPFMATENLLMAGVQAGGDRQALHERIRQHSLAAAERLKEGAADNDLIARLRDDPAFPPLNFDDVLDASRYVGRSPEQVEEFLRTEVQPIRVRYPEAAEGAREELRV
ncbi:Adenylosuccinate lyase [Aquisphaera giovannonii]|uniref:Adenylosuccinate lyase n=1 Tax=Aquisphaera giovannonii TaxID=406548 RepID=A0A5B9WAF7_9BACT|nr:adenylosuccinate lyase [Aquisphaera giovannonii]QEH37562.1 Adenylosuccinate lyase [Aquisphaera giovannonii]